MGMIRSQELIILLGVLKELSTKIETLTDEVKDIRKCIDSMEVSIDIDTGSEGSQASAPF